MGSTDTIDVVARDRLSLSVVTLSSFGSPNPSQIQLQGTASYQPQAGWEQPELVPIFVTVFTQDAQAFDTQLVAGSKLQIVTHDGSVVGPDITDYAVIPAPGGRYQIYSAVISEDDRQADVFAISDPFPLFLPPIVIAACLALNVPQFIVIQQTLSAYRAQGLVPKWRIRGSIGAALTCGFDIEMEGQDVHGKVIKKAKVQLKKGKGATKKN